MQQRLKIIALDPGVTTGWALGVIDDGYMRVRCSQKIFTHLELFDFLKGNRPEIIVCESFEFRKQMQGVNYYPVEMIGVVNLFVQTMATHGITVPLYLQPASIQGAKAYYTDQKLKDADVYDKRYPHGRSAMKHLLNWYTFGPGYLFNKKEFGPWQTQRGYPDDSGDDIVVRVT